MIPLVTASEDGKAHHVNLFFRLEKSNCGLKNLHWFEHRDKSIWNMAQDRVKAPFMPDPLIPQHAFSTSRVAWDCSSKLVVNSI